MGTGDIDSVPVPNDAVALTICRTPEMGFTYTFAVEFPATIVTAVTGEVHIASVKKRVPLATSVLIATTVSFVTASGSAGPRASMVA